MRGASGNDVSPLPLHEVQELVDEEGWREGGDSAARDRDRLPANRTPETGLCRREEK